MTEYINDLYNTFLNIILKILSRYYIGRHIICYIDYGIIQLVLSQGNKYSIIILKSN